MTWRCWLASQRATVVKLQSPQLSKLSSFTSAVLRRAAGINYQINLSTLANRSVVIECAPFTAGQSTRSSILGIKVRERERGRECNLCIELYGWHYQTTNKQLCQQQVQQLSDHLATIYEALGTAPAIAFFSPYFYLFLSFFHFFCFAFHWSKRNTSSHLHSLLLGLWTPLLCLFRAVRALEQPLELPTALTTTVA